MVDLHVFAVGALVVWLWWVFRLRDDQDAGEDFGPGHDDGSEPEEPSGPGGLRLPLPDAQPWHTRRRDRHGDRRAAPLTARRQAPHRAPTRTPAKRSPHS